jgi:hypothetical protein
MNVRRKCPPGLKVTGAPASRTWRLQTPRLAAVGIGVCLVLSGSAGCQTSGDGASILAVDAANATAAVRTFRFARREIIEDPGGARHVEETEGLVDLDQQTLEERTKAGQPRLISIGADAWTFDASGSEPAGRPWAHVKPTLGATDSVYSDPSMILARLRTGDRLQPRGEATVRGVKTRHFLLVHPLATATTDPTFGPMRQDVEVWVDQANVARRFKNTFVSGEGADQARQETTDELYDFGIAVHLCPGPDLHVAS